MTSFETEQAQLRRFRDGQYAQLHTGSWREWIAEPDVRLIPPLAEEFSVCGDRKTVERAREWALGQRLMLADVDYPCAHSLLLFGCPSFGSCCPAFDHTQIWVPYDEPQEPFILTHPYQDEIPEEIHHYARAHGLRVNCWPELGDRWYDPDALPIRLTVSNTEVRAWPLGVRATVLKHCFPIKWPDDAERAAWAACCGLQQLEAEEKHRQGGAA